MKIYRSLLILLSLIITNPMAYAEEVSQSIVAKKTKLIVTPEIGSTSFHIIGMDSAYLGGNSVGGSLRLATNNSQLSWSIGARYFQAGLKKVAKLGIFEFDVAQVQLDYLAAPLKAEYILNNPTASNASYFVDGGATLAYLLSAKEKILIGKDNREHGIRSQLKGMDMLLGLSFGCRYFSDIGILEAALEYQHGLFDVDKEVKSKNEGFVAKVGYNISI